MSRVVDHVIRVGSWAEVQLLAGKNEEARQRLTLTQRDTGLRLAQYREHPEAGKLFIPRGLVSASGVEVEGDWESLGVSSRWEPGSREGQDEAITDYMNALDGRAPYGGIMQAVTGAGKTVMALEIAARLDLKTLIIVPRDSLFDQWRQQILKWTSCTEEEIGAIRGQRRIYRGKKFVIAMIHTIAQQYTRYERELFQEFGTVIFDECHVVGAETFSQVAPLFRCQYRVGLSATPRRSDGMDDVFYWHIGPVIAKFTKLQAKPRVRVFNYRGQDTSHAGCVWGGNLNLGRYLNRVGRSRDRLQLLAKIVRTLDEKNNEILVLSDRINHLRALRHILVEQMGLKAEDIGFLIGSQKQLDKRIILGTYGSAGMGVDIPRLTALVLGTPRADIEQAVGRVLRQGTPIIVDIVDTASTIMQGWSGARLKYYRKITQDIQWSR